MADNHDHRPSRFAGPLLATSVVLLLGAVGLACIVAIGGEDPSLGLIIFVISMALILCIGFLTRAASVSASATAMSWVKSRHARPVNEYAPRTRRTSQTYGTNAPPSVEEVRDLKDGLNNWVPSNVPPRRPRRPRRAEH